jgi:hypothetical protein
MLSRDDKRAKVSTNAPLTRKDLPLTYQERINFPAARAAGKAVTPNPYYKLVSQVGMYE